MKVEHVHYNRAPEEPRWRMCIYLGQGFWDVTLGTHRWRWFW